MYGTLKGSITYTDYSDQDNPKEVSRNIAIKVNGYWTDIIDTDTHEKLFIRHAKGNGPWFDQDHKTVVNMIHLLKKVSK